jgi:signal transduction histidine kinase
VLPASFGMVANTALIAPLAFRGSGLGVLMAFDRTESGPRFTRIDEELLVSFAASAATAVHTARSVAQERLEHSLEASEHERSRWARELHDETLQALGGLQLLLASARREEDTKKRDALIDSASEHIATEIRTLRNLITELRPAELDEIGLESALEALAERRSRDGALRVSVNVDLGEAQQRLAPQVESTIYRVVQEALTNVAKHAEADQVDVRVGVINGSVDLTVADDGTGFDPRAAPKGWGLVGMKERIELMSGSLEFDSKPGAGTTIHALLPTGQRG